MADLLRQGAGWLTCQRDRHLAHDVVYRRGASEVTVRATRGATEYDSISADGNARVESRSVDFLIEASQLVLDAATVVPEVGDEIDETVGGLVMTYEVLPLIAGESPYEWSDQCRATVRVHTKLKVENASA